MTIYLQNRIALRLKTIREARGLSQTELSQRFEFNDRQTVSAIEGGSRRLAPEELARAAEIFEVPVDYFTDAFRLDGEGEFSFRVADVAAPVIAAFEEQAGRWVATYRELSAQEGRRPSHLGMRLELTPKSAFEDAWNAADELRGAWKLGDVAANELGAAIQREIGALVLYVDAPHGISGAATRLPGLNTILINRHEPVGRRNFDLAHELFHVLTWEAMKPDRVEPLEPAPLKGNRVEYLAENFAAAILMPAGALSKLWENRGSVDVHDWLNATATRFRVSATALKWRMRNLGHFMPADVAAIDEGRLVANGGTLADEAPPPPFSADFVRCIHAAVESGRLSLRRAAKLLGLRLSDFADLCRQYGLPLSYDA
jgi:XRE family transcriptional regulator, fatty acid utilization regulator